MRKLNNKGYMLVEIIMAFAITFALIYFLMDMVINLKNKNDDLLVDTVIKTDQTIISNKLMDYIIEDTSDEENIDFKCDNISVDGNSVKYGDNVIGIVDDSATISYDPLTDCSNINGKIHINIPVEIKQMPDKNYDIVVDYRYKLVYCNPTKSYWCANGSEGSEPYFMTYTGDCTVIDDGSDNWRVKFLTSGTFTVASNVVIDAFLVGGGAAGDNYRTGNYNGHNGGYGGAGGYTLTKNNFILNSNNGGYSIVIGQGGEVAASGANLLGGAGGASSAFGYTASGGTSSGGGSGGGAYGTYNGTYRCGAGGSGASDGESAGTKGQKELIGPNGETGSTREFGESTGDLYAGGGGGGAGRFANNTSSCSGDNGIGGEGGGGTSGDNNLVNGVANTGGGGAGQRNGRLAGAGGSGIVIIRNTR